MKPLLVAIASAAILTAGLARAEDTGPLVTVVTADNAQTQLMAMVLTAQAVEQGHAVRVLLCGPAGDIALADAPESATAGQPPMGASPQGLMQKIMASGATVEVCAIYLPGKGLQPDALIDGVGVAQPPDMAAAMLADDTVVWSF
jgi:intracellular sulfur oxidation DsrE/DsrF family protein